VIGEALPGGEAGLRHAGREFLLVLYASYRNLKLYPLENAVVQKALDELQAATTQLLEAEGEIEIRLSGDFIFVNQTRLRLELDNYASFSQLLGLLRRLGIGAIRVEPGMGRREWQIVLGVLLAIAARDDEEGDRYGELAERLGRTDVTHLTLEPATELDDLEDAARAREIAKRTYAQGVAVTKEVVNGMRIGRVASIKRVKRAVQLIVDQVLNNEVSLLGLTTLRDYDEYTFTHSVNVCIFSVAMGRRFGLTKIQLYDLGLAALLHDIGKVRIPLTILNKAGGLEETEWRTIQNHPWQGVIALFGMRGYDELPARAVLVAHEHHMKTDLTGYPRAIRPRELGLFSRIVSVADGFDAATTRRAYQTIPIQPDEVLREMYLNPRRGLDQVIVKGMINLLGIYPAGTCVILDTFEVAVVEGANPDPMFLNRPLIRLAVDTDGGRVAPPGTPVSLSDRGADGFTRSIVKVTDPARYGITPSDYLI
jgi:HD-GYP domain-containing protein (c-di-GMP phosphodiesterase class II)